MFLAKPKAASPSDSPAAAASSSAAAEYSLISRAKCAASSPCTNRPVKCPVCDLYGWWSYNMERHVAEGASGSVAIQGYGLAHHEREWLRPFLTTNKSKLKACILAECPCKK